MLLRWGWDPAGSRENAGKDTYHDGHAGALDDGAEREDANGYLPACGATLDSAGDNDDEGDDGAELDDDAERGQETDGPPHVAEGRVLCAVAHLGKGDTGARDGGAATVEAVRVFALAVGAVADPSRHRDTGDGHDGACAVSQSHFPL